MNITLDERIKQEIGKPLSMKKLEAKMRYIYRHQGNLSFSLSHKKKNQSVYERTPNKSTFLTDKEYTI